MKEFVKERDKAVRTAIMTDDLRVFKRFYAKWKARGAYNIPLPSDRVLEISLRKMMYHMADATPEEKAMAEMWLLLHGSSTSV